ncbi:prenyltransferase/squalene oxidase repeat-containing protein [Streptomyces cadmiisoli]|uniref:PT domain-containing protein n=1 Tax=Streptomyces cadmiisoli TaxID=2184053 RepID=UPI0036651C3C
MVGVRPPVKLAAALGAGGSFLAAGLITLSPSAVAQPRPDAATAAAQWQAGELENGAIPGFSPGIYDWGLTVDTLIALKATGADDAAADKVVDTLKVHVRDYNSYDAWGEPGQRVSGATAKLLYAAVAAGENPAEFGEYNLRQETLDLIAGPEKGLEEGRLKDKVLDGSDNSNTFGQSLAVVGLARSGDVPQSAVDFLIDQQCAAGGFRLYPYAFGSGTVTGDCDAQGDDAVLDPDSTAMAVQALLAAAEDGAEGAAAAAKKGGDWLAAIQHDDGALMGSGPTAFPNANSTGLGGQALAATGHQAAADKAAAWVEAHQITSSNAGAASAETGTIAYNDEALTGAQADGISEFQRDQWRRSTPQALLTLAQIPLGEIGNTDPGPGPDPSDDPSNDPSNDPSGDPSDDPSGDPSDDPSGDPSDTPGGDPSQDPSGEPSSTPSDNVSGSPTPTVGATTPTNPAPVGGNGPLASTGSSTLVIGGTAAVLTAAGYAAFRAAKRRQGAHT